MNSTQPVFCPSTAKAASTAHSCGLEGMAAVNVTLPGGRRCAGTLSDWDSYTCSAGPRLTLSLPGCVHGSDMLQGEALEFSTCILIKYGLGHESVAVLLSG